MYLQKIFAAKLKGISDKDIAGQMGYNNLKSCESKIKKLLSCPYLCLKDSDYDLKYSTDEFLVKLGQVLEIPAALVDKVIEEIQAELLQRRKRFHSYIFIQTHFRRENQPIFVLACLEGKRHITIDIETRQLSLDGQLPKVRSLIHQHYRSTDGELMIWGKIAEYVFYYEKDLAITFSPSGELIEAKEKHITSRATLSIRG